jgi:hypothetical protein
MSFVIIEACITVRYDIRVSDRIQCSISSYRNTSSSFLFINCFSTVYKQFALQKKKFSEIKLITAQTVLLDHETADVPINETIEHICRPNSAACIYLCFHDTL